MTLSWYFNNFGFKVNDNYSGYYTSKEITIYDSNFGKVNDFFL